MASKLVDHALSSPNLSPQSITEALLLLSVAPDEVAIRFLQQSGKKWAEDIEVRRIYIDLLEKAQKYTDLRDFSQNQLDQGVDDWKVVTGVINAWLGLIRLDSSQTYVS